MQANLTQVLRAMSQAADLGEAKELGHGQRVCILALELASATGAFTASDLAELAVAALLHDVGIPSVTHELYEHNGASYRRMLARYPAWPDGDFGAEIAASEAFAPLVPKHQEVGVELLQQLGYGVGVTNSVRLHHARIDGRGWPTRSEWSELPLSAQILSACDQLESASYTLGTAEGRRQTCEAMLEQMGGTVIDADLVEIARDHLTSTEVWERVFFFDEVGAMLEDIFAPTYGIDLQYEGLEAHLRVLALMSDSHSPYSRGHTLEVARLAQRIGERIGLDMDALRRAYLGSLVHGVGKLGISSAIIEKGSGLTDEQFVELRTYPALTREALRPIEALRTLVDEVSTHREKLDGSGYPEGRHGDDIPLLGRIVGVADTFVALTSDRPYRAAYSKSRALAIVQAESARLFDGLVTDALEGVYREGL